MDWASGEEEEFTDETVEQLESPEPQPIDPSFHPVESPQPDETLEENVTMANEHPVTGPAAEADSQCERSEPD